ncbi:hypothetical protein Ancab_031660 [Ancistrocladus abbreviatus]
MFAPILGDGLALGHLATMDLEDGQRIKHGASLCSLKRCQPPARGIRTFVQATAVQFPENSSTVTATDGNLGNSPALV